MSFISTKWAYPQTTYCVLSQQVAGWFPGPEAHDDLGSALQIDGRGGQWRRAEHGGRDSPALKGDREQGCRTMMAGAVGALKDLG